MRRKDCQKLLLQLSHDGVASAEIEMAWNQHNWRRGLFRLWLVTSALWIAGMLVFVVPVGLTQNIFAAITNPNDPNG